MPEGTCVAGDLHAGIGGFDVFGHGSGGIDVDRFEDGRAPAGTPRVVVTGDVGLGCDHDRPRACRTAGTTNAGTTTTGGTMTATTQVPMPASATAGVQG